MRLRGARAFRAVVAVLLTALVSPLNAAHPAPTTKVRYHCPFCTSLGDNNRTRRAQLQAERAARGAGAPQASGDAPPTRRATGVLPRIHDLSGAPPKRVNMLIQEALDGMGLQPPKAPREEDRVFVGRWYIAWVDETGFYGKMNGLWGLNGDLDNLDFVLVESAPPRQSSPPPSAPTAGAEVTPSSTGKRSRRDFSFSPGVPYGDCLSKDGRYFRGTLGVTISGRVCQRWDSQSPNQHDYTPEKYPYAGLDGNYCRNPDHRAAAWCFVADASSGIDWQYCDVCFGWTNFSDDMRDFGPRAPTPTPASAYVPPSDAGLRARATCNASGLHYGCGDPRCAGYRSCATDSNAYGCACAADSAEASRMVRHVQQRGRPVNSLVVGEFGDGVWPKGYQGAEHAETPNYMPTEGDDEDCGNKGFCAQYAHREATTIMNPELPAWMSCNWGRPGWDDHTGEATSVSLSGDGRTLTLWYEGPLTREADFGGTYSGRSCHTDWIFADGVARTVYLRVGYSFNADADYVDRHYQVRNPWEADWYTYNGMIGGFVATAFPNPHPLKKLQRFARTGPADQYFNSVPLTANEWVELPVDLSEDQIFSWADQHVSLSPAPRFVRGRTQSNNNVDDGGGGYSADIGFCFCVATGGVELGGGLLKDIVVNAGVSPVATRRLALHLDPSQSEGAAAEALCDPSSGNQGSLGCDARDATETRVNATLAVEQDDLDGDATLSRAEYSYEELFDAADSDGSGSLDADELQAFFAARDAEPIGADRISAGEAAVVVVIFAAMAVVRVFGARS